jgi:hypothetical protein
MLCMRCTHCGRVWACSAERPTLLAKLTWLIYRGNGTERGCGMGLFRIFKAGDIVPTSGVYAVLHSTPHALIQRELYLKGTRFQRCKLCPLGVLYRLETPSVDTLPTDQLATDAAA